MNRFKHICESVACTGCGACHQVCPVKCIQMEQDSEGFLRPVIGDGCILCNRCRSDCPANRPTARHEPLDVMIAYRNEREKIMISSSGGIAAALSERFVVSGGYVFGAAMNSVDISVCHEMCHDVIGIGRFAGSKYIQSNIGTTFIETEELLKKGERVLYTGTPCQIAGLKNFLKKDWPGLYTVDFICHGVASPLVFKMFIESSIPGADIDDIQFRNKEKGYRNSLMVISTRGGQSMEWGTYASSFGKAFANNLISRPSCGQCAYAVVSRVADITLADYIGADINAEEEQYGTSMVLINTTRGQELFGDIQSWCTCRLKSLSQAAVASQHLRFPAYTHKYHRKFFQAIEKKGYEFAIAKYSVQYQSSLKIQIRNRLIDMTNVIRRVGRACKK